jgi:hypothetical protein
MVRLRNEGLNPDFSNPRDENPPSQVHAPLKDWPSDSEDFRIRYLIEGLLSHSVITEPELPDLRAALSGHNGSESRRVLEGLFVRRNRKSTLQEDLACEVQLHLVPEILLLTCHLKILLSASSKNLSTSIACSFEGVT